VSCQVSDAARIVDQPEVEKWLSFSTRITEVSPLKSPRPAIGCCWVAQEP
jgi:hypothetical protein